MSRRSSWSYFFRDRLTAFQCKQKEERERKLAFSALPGEKWGLGGSISQKIYTKCHKPQPVTQLCVVYFVRFYLKCPPFRVGCPHQIIGESKFIFEFCQQINAQSGAALGLIFVAIADGSEIKQTNPLSMTFTSGLTYNKPKRYDSGSFMRLRNLPEAEQAINDDSLVSHPAWNTSVHGTLVGHWIWIWDNDEGWLLKEGDSDMEFLWNTLWRDMTATRPDNVFDVQPVPTVPDSNLKVKGFVSKSPNQSADFVV